MRTSGIASSSSSTDLANSVPGHAIDFDALGKQTATETEIILAQDHARPGPRRRPRRHQTGRTGADHQHIAEGGGLLIGIGIGQAACASRGPRRGG